MSRQLFFGDNLQVMRERIADASVDLIYLDPPFNSKRDYNLLFKTPRTLAKKAKKDTAVTDVAPTADDVFSDAQITAFDDTWHWGDQSEDEFRQIGQQSNTDVAELMRALRAFLRENDMMAYLTCMAIRLLELRRVLTPTGSLYLHCDPTASHYLKIVLDAVFGKESYRNEIVWKRTTTHSDSKTWSWVADTIFFYTKGTKFTWNTPREAHSANYIATKYRHDDGDGRGLYQLDNMTSPNPRPNMMYEWKGFPWPEKGWRYERATMKKLDSEGRVWYPQDKSGKHDFSKRPRLKRYLSEMEGGVMGTVWTDINPINSQAAERLGYPTQKPLALLERIILASSKEGDVVLDPFCGCGTALDAAQKLKRQWIGIDITHLAIGLIERRLKDRYPDLREKGAFAIDGRPEDLGAARRLAELDKHQFQYWALSLVGAQPYKGGRKGADGGVDGLIYPEVGKGKTEKIIVSVKGGDNVGVLAIRDLIATVGREKAAVGVLITLNPPTKPMVGDAAAAGFYESPHHAPVPKIQILTIEGLLSDHERLKFVDMSYGGQTFKAAKAEDRLKKSDMPKLF